MSNGEIRIQLDDAKLQEMIGANILTMITEEKRDAIVASAIKMLLAPVARNYGPATSPLQEAFQNAALATARSILDAKLANDVEFQKEVGKLVNEAWERFHSSPELRKKVVEHMATGIANAFKTDRY